MKTIFLGLLLLAQTTFASTTASYEGSAKVKLTYYSFGNDGQTVISAMAEQCMDEFLGMACLIFRLPLITIGTLGWPLWARLSMSAESTSPVQAGFTAYLEDFQNGRAQLILKGEKTKKCEAVNLRFLAEEDSFGGYKLYASEEASSKEEVAGTLLKMDKDLRLEVTSAAKLVTKGKANKDCVWHLDEGFQVKLSPITL